ncbi:protein of unknown function [Pseudorhizobium banfieldiae]|uniref:Uncharacterized protein n=1 Tax=Pseudorhizobium banfieldiae TaxID=1125847 RepID=L0NDH2_9HYPH|nr:hypothetical protein [Pseudorhizobium banfieldiae]CAD6606130.1 hypothetical protein RNT25_01792 [arsenite-oxidising bacterium NT-25]CCF19138.1 protein of unknown function [Pseudorhizobium banfieldiae]
MPSPSIVTLSCGCFFRGREFVQDPKCDEHPILGDEDDEDEWSCENCGETAMDGGDRCITCGCEIVETACCDACGRTFALDELDAKPTINSRLRRTRQREGQLMMLYRAAARGYDFDRLECRQCYGPGYLAIP